MLYTYNNYKNLYKQYIISYVIELMSLFQSNCTQNLNVSQNNVAVESKTPTAAVGIFKRFKKHYNVIEASLKTIIFISSQPYHAVSQCYKAAAYVLHQMRFYSFYFRFIVTFVLILVVFSNFCQAFTQKSAL